MCKITGMPRRLVERELMSALNWKRKIGALAGVMPVASPRKVILLYHSLGPNPPAVTIARFREQLSWLAANARLLSLDALLASAGNDALQVAFTFDDGYMSLHDKVAPLLQQYAASATVYLNTGQIDENTRRSSDTALGHYPNEQFLTWPEVQALATAGWCIGSHGVEHLDLTAATTVVATAQLAQSKQEIAARTGRACQHFAYTWGRYNPALQQHVRAAGYLSAASGLHGPLKVDADLYALPRIDVRAEYELRDFVAAVSGQWDYLGYKQRLWRALA